MLWKLLKYDFRSMWKQFAMVWPAALVIGLINRFTLDGRFAGSDVGGITSIITISLFFGVMFAMFVVSMVFVLSRFYRGLLGDEGYLMHTLPVRTWQLVLSKLICALAVCVLNGVVAALAMFLMVPLADLFNWKLLSSILKSLSRNPEIVLRLVEFFLVMLAGLAFLITMVYLSMAVGHLFSRRRKLMSVAAFFVLYILVSVVSSILDWSFLAPVLDGSQHLEVLFFLLLLLIPSGLFFAGTSYILKTHLNLE